MFLIKLNEEITLWNLIYQLRDACLSPYINFLNLQIKCLLSIEEKP